MAPDRDSVGTLSDLTRRTLLGGAAGALAWASATPAVSADGAELDLLAGSGRWLGTRFWGNRLQDWIVRDGRMECVAEPSMRLGRTVAVLTHELRGAPLTLTVRTGTLETGAGFSGFVIGTGVPGEDSRRRALLGSASGTGGGLIAYVDHTGTVGFRDHSGETQQLSWPVIPSSGSGSPQPRTLGEDLTLRLTLAAVDADTVRATVAVTRTGSPTVLSSATIGALPRARVRGGLALMSSAQSSAARYWFTGLSASGAGVAVIRNRGLGPVAGTLFTTASRVLRMTVQLMPLDPRTLSRVALEVRRGNSWRRLGTAPVGPGYTALFRVTGFDTSTATGYRIVGAGQTLYGGTIPAEPRGRLRIASVNCTKASHRPLDSITGWSAKLPGSHPLDLYSRHNIYFPHEQLVAGIAAKKPDLLVAHGDQLYETSPTRRDNSAAPELDFLYKFLMWHWSMRPLTRRVPTVVLTDDHDVYQGNLWGEGGIKTTDQRTGGYLKSADWVNLVQRMSSWHNPDRYDTRPIAQGITVGYAAFVYGGTSFAIVEDRKFKTGPVKPGAAALHLLGSRQEAFLSAWARMHGDAPKVILTGSTWACVQTNVDGAAKADPDSHGWPKVGRDRAVRLAHQANALILAGDQHVGHLIRHGIDGFADGPYQFTPPAGSSSFQRWFQPSRTLPNSGGTPHTGDFTDAFGNRLRVLAVANPRFTLAQLWEHFTPPAQDFGDRGLKREGFGLIHFDHAARRVRMECWPYDTAAGGGGQYAGWPVTVSYDAL